MDGWNGEIMVVGGVGVGFFGGFLGEGDVRCIHKALRNCRKSALFMDLKSF